MFGHTKWASRATAVTAVIAATTLAFSGLAFADTLQDTIGDSGASVTLVAGSGVSGSAGIRVVGNNAAGDPDDGCNIDAGESPLKLDIVTPAGVTANPDPLSITRCGDYFPVTFTASSSAVSGTVTVSVTSSPAGGGTYVNQVDIPITVTQPPNTAPMVSVTGVTNGSTYEKSSVLQPGCSVTDAEDTGESATPQITGGGYNALGTHTVTCTYTDGGGITRSASATYTVVRDRDTTPPVITKTVTGTQGSNDWYTGNVSLDWTVTESESPGTLVLDGCVDVTVSADQAATDYACSATSEGGNAVKQTVSIKRDGTAPVVSYDGVVAGTLGDNGWYTSDVTAEFTGTDALSGPVTATKTVTSSGEGSAVTVGSPAFIDEAGNTTAAGAITKTYKIDKSAPNAPTASLDPAPNGAGWNNSNVVVSFTGAGDNGPSGIATCTADVPVNTETASQTVAGTCTDNAGNVSATAQVTVKLDKTGPSISNTVLVAGTAGNNGWYTSNVVVTFTATDSLSGPGTATASVTSSGEGAAVSVESPAFSDDADNTTAAGAVTKSYKIDKSAPSVPTFNGGPGGSYYFGNDPAAPTCSSSDAVSGLASCDVTGGGTAVGPHVYTATATDNAGNVSTATLNYTVLAWTAKGFYAPVDMGGVYNTVKGGSTVPLKFELFAGATEKTDISAVASFKTAKITCTGGALEDAIEIVSTGGTSLRYDSTGGQFIQNWKTPTGAGSCYSATMTASDGSSITAFFKIK